MIKDIEIIEYKCFKNLKLEGLSKINIITGGNNVGKTALLEALFIEDEIAQDKSLSFNINSILRVAKNRDVHKKGLKRYLESFNLKIKTDRSYISIGYKNRYELKDGFKKQAEEFNSDYDGFLMLYKSLSSSNIFLKPTINIEYSDYNINFLNYMNSSTPTTKRVIDLYFNIQTKAIQDEFLEYLKIIDGNISRVEPYYIDGRLTLKVNLINPKYSLTLFELGDATSRFIEILSILLSNSGGVVFIDDIDCKIDLSKLKEIFKVIIKIVKNEKIQLFVTLQNRESMKLFNRACEELEYKDIKLLELIKESITIDIKNLEKI